MNNFMSWVGGKKALREEIVQRFPLSYERYIEVFGGGGWVLFHKPPGRDFEVYNDFNSLLANLYRCVRDRHEELIDSLRYVLNSREDFELIKQALARDNVNLPEGQREDALGRSPASSYVKGYTVTADYTGTVSRIALNKTRYVAIFEGTPLQPLEPVDDRPDTMEPAPATSFNWPLLLVPLGLIAAAGGGIGIALFLKRRSELAEGGDEDA